MSEANGQTPKKREFTSKQKYEPIQVDGEEYVVEQMSGAKLERYRAAVRKRYSFDQVTQTAMLDNQEGMTQELFDFCLYKVMPGSQRTQEPIKGIAERWSGECCEQVYAVCQEVNGLSAAGQDEAKKD